MNLLPSRQGHGDLGPSVGQVEVQRNQREALLLDRTDQAADLTAVQQELAAPGGDVLHVSP